MLVQPFEQFEWELGQWVNRGSNVVACSSGTAALHLALETLSLPPGTKVIVPNLTMVACARAVTLAGLEPVFVDCDKDMLMNVDLLKHTNSKDIHAIMAVHIYGRRCNMEAIHQYAAQIGAVVIEDMAEAHGVKPHTLTHAACYSFYKNKIVAGEEGGAIVFNEVNQLSGSWVRTAKSLRSLGFNDNHDFDHIPRGHNYRMSNAHATLCLDGLRGYHGQLAVRWAQYEWFNATCPNAWKLPRPRAPWVYDFRISGLTSDKQTAIVRRLNISGIAARHCFKPMSNQVEYAMCSRYVSEPESTCDRMSREVIYLPLKSNVELNGEKIFKVIQDELTV